CLVPAPRAGADLASLVRGGLHCLCRPASPVTPAPAVSRLDGNLRPFEPRHYVLVGGWFSGLRQRVPTSSRLGRPVGRDQEKGGVPRRKGQGVRRRVLQILGRPTY